MSADAPTQGRTAISQNGSFDPAWYTWRQFFRHMFTNSTTIEEQKQYVQARSIINESAQCQSCEKHRDWLLSYSPVVRFLRDEVRKVGGEVNDQNIICRRCDSMEDMRAGFLSPNTGITLCANHLMTKSHQEDVMTHEMVHAYDHLRFNVDMTNMRHMACTEIRASMLSGECRLMQEFFGRHQWKFTSHFPECVRRNAITSIRMQPSIKSDAEAAKVVNDVFGSCFADTRPFDEIWR